MFFAVIEQVKVDKFGAIVGINAAKVKWHSLLHRNKGLKNILLPFAHNGPAFNPLGENISPVDGIGKIA